MIKISVIVVTNKSGAVEFLKTQLDKQTFKDFEVIIADDGGNPKLYEKQFTPRQKGKEDVWNLNKAYNDCFQKVEGQLIVFYQDFIKIQANGLQRFWDIYQLYPNDLITGCGHKYLDGKIAETDDRVFGEKALVESDWTYYELNWSSCPTEIAPKFEEDMDTHYGGENQIFAFKSGANVWLDRMNECKGEMHNGRPDNWESKHSNRGFLNQKIKDIWTESNRQSKLKPQPNPVR